MNQILIGFCTEGHEYEYMIQTKIIDLFNGLSFSNAFVFRGVVYNSFLKIKLMFLCVSWNNDFLFNDNELLNCHKFLMLNAINNTFLDIIGKPFM